MRRLQWEERDPELKRRWRDNEPLDDIALALGCSRRAVSMRVEALELPIRPPVRRSQKGEPREVNGLPPDVDQRKMRRCLARGCGQMFLSEHPGRRICPRCAPIVERVRGGMDAVPY